MNARSEPLLWLQLIAVGVLPLEALLLLLLLAGSDPGPVPGLERLLCWGLGGLLPAVALWRRPADVWSLLLLKAPIRARRPLQQRLSALQEAPAMKASLVGGSALLLALLWWSDEHAAIAGPFSPLAANPRLVGLLLAALLLALMLWQWQQLLQSLWLLGHGADTIAATAPLSTRELESRRLCLGLPLLLIDPLVATPASRPKPGTRSTQVSEPAPAGISGPPLPTTSRQTEAGGGRALAAPSPPAPAAEQVQSSEPPNQKPIDGDAGNAVGRLPSAAGPAQFNSEAEATEAVSSSAVALAEQAAEPVSSGPSVGNGPIDAAATGIEAPPIAATMEPADSPDREERNSAPSEVAGHGTDPTQTASSPLPPDSAEPRAERTRTEKQSPKETAAAEGSPDPDAWESDPSAAVPVAIEPEQGAEDGKGGDLDQQVGGSQLAAR